MGKIGNKELSQLISDKIKELDQLHELTFKVELIESEIIGLIGEDFNPSDFFGDDGTAALDYFDKEVGDEYTPLGTFEDPEAFIRDLDLASDEEAERLAPQYYAENIVYEDEDGALEENMTSYEFDGKYRNHPKHDDIKSKLIQRAEKVYPEFTRGEGDSSRWFIKTNSPNLGEVKVSIDDSWVSFSGEFDLINPAHDYVSSVEISIHFLKNDLNYPETIIKADNAGSFQAANRASANKLVKDLKPMIANALGGLKKDFAQGRQGGYNEKNRELMKGLIAKIQNLKANDVVGKGSL